MDGVTDEPDELGELGINELRIRARELGLSSGGKPAELRARIRAAGDVADVPRETSHPGAAAEVEVDEDQADEPHAPGVSWLEPDDMRDDLGHWQRLT